MYETIVVYSNSHGVSMQETADDVVSWVWSCQRLLPYCALIVCGKLLKDTGFPEAQKRAERLVNDAEQLRRLRPAPVR